MNLSIGRNGSEIGEWSEDDVRALYAQGQLLPTDYYWIEGMAEWKELGTFIKPPPPSDAVPLETDPSESAMTNDNAEKSCYYCNAPIPPQALLCPGCGKERKELHELRMGWKRWLFSGILFLSVAVCILVCNSVEAIHAEGTSPDRYGPSPDPQPRWSVVVGRDATGSEMADAFFKTTVGPGGVVSSNISKLSWAQYRFSLAKMLSDWLFWFALGLGVPATICCLRADSYSTRYFSASGKKIADLVSSGHFTR